MEINRILKTLRRAFQFYFEIKNRSGDGLISENIRLD